MAEFLMPAKNQLLMLIWCCLGRWLALPTYRLCLTLSHQYVDQIPLPIRQAVFGNVGTLFSFRVGNTDAEALQKEFGNTFIAQQFVDLERFNVFTKILENGTNKEPFKGVTVQPMGNSVGKAVAHVDNSRKKFARGRANVETTLARWQYGD